MTPADVPPPACSCPGPGRCPTFNRPMRVREYELCSGNCPAGRPCPDAVRAKYRRAWWAARDRPRPADPPGYAPRPAGGPGTELKALLASVGLKAGGCQCDARAAAMDGWGAAGCREHEAEILAWLRAECRRLTWAQWARAAARAVATGLAFRLNPLDPAPGLLEEALRRAAAAGGA